MNNMQELCKFITPYNCKICNNPLYFLSNDNILIDYKYQMNISKSSYELKNYLSNRKVKYIKCIICNKLFIIDWSNVWPEQLIDRNMLNKFGVCR